MNELIVKQYYYDDDLWCFRNIFFNVYYFWYVHVYHHNWLKHMHGKLHHFNIKVIIYR